MNDSGAALIWSPFGSEAEAEEAAGVLLDEGLVACANLIPIRSLYRWQGKRGEGREVAVLFKTSAARLDDAIASLTAIHPYETPVIMGWPVDRANSAAMAWLAAESGGE